jgi:purine-binding chemotaxis protein CheW
MTDNFDKTRLQDKGNATKGEPRQFLTFSVMDEEYGVDIMTVREIKGWTQTTRLPNSSECLRGVMNLRGLIIPIFDLRARFSKTLTDASAKHVVIILAVGGRNIGILVDAVSDILTVGDADIKSAPEGQNQPEGDFIAGLISLGNRMVVLLKVEHLFDEKSLPPAETIAA